MSLCLVDGVVAVTKTAEDLESISQLVEKNWSSTVTYVHPSPPPFPPTFTPRTKAGKFTSTNR